MLYRVYTTIQTFGVSTTFFFYTIIQLGHFWLIESDSKDIYNVIK